MNKEITKLKKKRIKSRNSVMILNNKSSILDSGYTLNKDPKIITDFNMIKFNSKNNVNIYNLSCNSKNNENKLSSQNNNKDKNFFLFRGNNFSDFELNELDYLEAVKYDKRTFFQFYWYLIRREHLIFFTFLSFNDYNIISIKLSKFIFALATDFAINVIFFFDETMNKIYLDYGKYNFIIQIPQVIYSTIVSEVFDLFLRYLCLTEKDMYKIKKIMQKKEKLADYDVFKILKCIKIKLFLYFIFTHLFFFFFWYFVSAFCAVYKNTQIILFKDSFMSLFLSLLYPFAFYLLPTTLRIIALRDTKQKSYCLYKSSDIIPLV